MSSTTTISVLALHGWRTNKDILEFQMKHLVNALKALNIVLELHILNAPKAASGPPQEAIVTFFGEQETFEWWEFIKMEDDSYTYEGAEDSIKFIEDYINKQEREFDIVLGFSQGSILIGILNALFKSKKLTSEVSDNTYPWKLAIHVSGALPRESTYKAVVKNASPISLPSVFLLGSSDYLLATAEELASNYDSEMCRIFRFDEGHKFPSKSTFDYESLAKYIKNKVL